MSVICQQARVVVAAVVALITGCGAVSQPLATTPIPATSGVTVTTQPTVTASATRLDRLTIAAINARTYTASALTAVRAEGDQGGYSNSVVSFQSDGLTEYALLSIPGGAAPAKGWPVIVLNHGFIDPARYVTDDASYTQFIAAFAHAGYMVIKPDYRGNGKSQGVPEGGHFSPVYAYDLLNLIATLKIDPRVDATRIGLFAHSMGGHEALRAMVASHDVKAVVFMAGVVGSFDDIFYNWPNSPVATDPPAAVQQARDAEIAAHGAPAQNPAYWASASAINFVASSSAVVQINQDSGDSVVPALFAEHLNAALVAAGKTVQYIKYPGNDHQFTANRDAILVNAVAFYRAHL